MADLPTYTVKTTPAELATVTQLRELRRRPGPRQKPAGRLLYAGNKHTDLYRIADADLLPALTAKQRERVVAREHEHLCTACGAYRDFPPAQDGVGGRLCSSCREIARVQSLLDRRPAWRARTAGWAREVLADPTTMVVAVRAIDVRQPDVSMVIKKTAVVDVAVLAVSGDNERDWLLTPQETPRRKRDLPDGGSPIVDVVDEITDQIVGRRIVAWTQYAAMDLAADLRDAATGYGKSGRTDTIWSQRSAYNLLHVPELELLRRQYSDWVGQIFPRDEYYPVVQQSLAPGQPIDQAHWMLRTLRRMAETEI